MACGHGHTQLLKFNKHHWDMKPGWRQLITRQRDFPRAEHLLNVFNKRPIGHKWRTKCKTYHGVTSSRTWQWLTGIPMRNCFSSPRNDDHGTCLGSITSYKRVEDRNYIIYKDKYIYIYMDMWDSTEHRYQDWGDWLTCLTSNVVCWPWHLTTWLISLLQRTSAHRLYRGQATVSACSNTILPPVLVMCMSNYTCQRGYKHTHND